MKLTIQMCTYIRQHGRAVYVGMVVVIVYHNNTMENAASILQSGNRAHRTVEEKCALYRRQWYLFFHMKMRQRVEDVHDIFYILTFSSNSSNSSSPGSLAHERWGVGKWFNHRTALHSTQCIPLYLRGQRDAVCIWHFSSFFVRRLLMRHHLHWCCFLQMAAYPNGRAGICRKRNLAHFIEFASGNGPFFWLDWQSLHCYPPRTERRMDQR